MKNDPQLEDYLDWLEEKRMEGEGYSFYQLHREQATDPAFRFIRARNYVEKVIEKL